MISEIRFINYVWFYDFYQVYDDGRIYSTYQKCWMTPQVDFNGSGIVVYLPHWVKPTLNAPWKYLIACCHVPRPDESYDRVKVLDGNEWNVRADNLQWYRQAVDDPYEGKSWKNSSRSVGNSKRWNNEEFRRKMSQRFSEIMRSQDNTGNKNPNFRYYIRYNGRDYTVKEMSSLMGIAELRAYAIIKQMRRSRPNAWSDMGAILIDVRKQKGQSTIEKASEDVTE